MSKKFEIVFDLKSKTKASLKEAVDECIESDQSLGFVIYDSFSIFIDGKLVDKGAKDCTDTLWPIEFIGDLLSELVWIEDEKPHSVMFLDDPYTLDFKNTGWSVKVDVCADCWDVEKDTGYHRPIATAILPLPEFKEAIRDSVKSFLSKLSAIAPKELMESKEVRDITRRIANLK